MGAANGGRCGLPARGRFGSMVLIQGKAGAQEGGHNSAGHLGWAEGKPLALFDLVTLHL